MRTFPSGLSTKLAAAQDEGIAPVHFLYVEAKDALGEVVPFGFWSGDDNITLNVETTDGGVVARTYVGGVNMVVGDLPYVADLTDNSVPVKLSQISDAVQSMVRGHNIKYAYAEVHATSWLRGILASVPALMWVGIVDTSPIATPEVGADGAISVELRSQIMKQLMTSNPAKSSHEHQRRRLATDNFCIYSGPVATRNLQWYRE